MRRTKQKCAPENDSQQRRCSSTSMVRGLPGRSLGNPLVGSSVTSHTPGWAPRVRCRTPRCHIPHCCASSCLSLHAMVDSSCDLLSPSQTTTCCAERVSFRVGPAFASVLGLLAKMLQVLQDESTMPWWKKPHVPADLREIPVTTLSTHNPRTFLLLCEDAIYVTRKQVWSILHGKKNYRRRGAEGGLSLLTCKNSKLNTAALGDANHMW